MRILILLPVRTYHCTFDQHHNKSRSTYEHQNTFDDIKLWVWTFDAFNAILVEAWDTGGTQSAIESELAVSGGIV